MVYNYCNALHHRGFQFYAQTAGVDTGFFFPLPNRGRIRDVSFMPIPNIGHDAIRRRLNIEKVAMFGTRENLIIEQIIAQTHQ